MHFKKKTRKYFGWLLCNWCGRWTLVMPNEPRTDKNLKMWQDRMEKLYLCKRERCLASRC
jgi:hypothetical protein